MSLCCLDQSNGLVRVDDPVDRTRWTCVQQPLVDAGGVEPMSTGQISHDVALGVRAQADAALLTGQHQAAAGANT